MFKKFLKITSGKPKEGDIIEKIKIFPFISIMLISLVSLYISIEYKNIFFGILSILFAWQTGWGMSVERFKISEHKSDFEEK